MDYDKIILEYRCKYKAAAEIISQIEARQKKLERKIEQMENDRFCRELANDYQNQLIGGADAIRAIIDYQRDLQNDFNIFIKANGLREVLIF